ncbi:MaoC family dehydratase [Acuticoccus sp. MNP-M23]|uniref:MaoC family dehydratase n=1 Tax=Acuticoccus sp. MNP-M23 TaxID=3072793 RepID=UPI002814F8C9|nr:MaoC family dehydratase [Acuticoccus sp. MNP-M23]WMS45123.1 MaoC family dehydratase [Acuticoccus sp. MNP-M23]
MAGLYYEDFEVGTVTRHTLSRTITEADNILFSNMTLNPQPLHIDRHYCERHTEWGQPIVNSLFTLGLLIGISVNDLTIGTTVANLGMSETRFPHPLFNGDSLYAETRVLSKRGSKSRPDVGLVELEHTGRNQNGVIVAVTKRVAMMKKRET